MWCAIVDYIQEYIIAKFIYLRNSGYNVEFSIFSIMGAHNTGDNYLFKKER